MAMRKMDLISYNISSELDKLGLKNILIPTDDPYLHWNKNKQEGKAILSLRHAGYLAGLGKLGRNNLLINKEYGNRDANELTLYSYFNNEKAIFLKRKHLGTQGNLFCLPVGR